MKKGKLIVEKSKKGKVFAKLEKENGKVQPLSFLHLKNTDLNGKDCEYNAIGGQILKIVVGENAVYDKSKSRPPQQTHKKGFNKRPTDKRVNNEYSITEENTKLPEDTAKILSGKESVIDNFNLKLNKTILFKRDNKKNCDVPRLHESEYKGKKFEVDFDFTLNQNITQSISERQKVIEQQFISQSKILETNWRTAVGLGNPSVFETNITLHHVYGIPYVPGSAVKGVIRHWVIKNKFENDETKALKNKEFCDIYGCDSKSYYKEARQGNIIFFDAFPIVPPTVEPDVMNVHYPDYYGGSKPPTDFQNPNPIFFLTVKETKFNFLLGVKKENNKNLLDTAFDWLKQALENHGIGAKTAVGYGRMQTDQSKND